MDSCRKQLQTALAQMNEDHVEIVKQLGESYRLMP